MDLPASHFLSSPRDRAQLDTDYAPSRFVPSLLNIIADWGRRTEAAQAAHGARFVPDVAYGPHPRERIDLYRAEAPTGRVLVFIHGGFWQAVSKAESGFLAGGWTARGVDVAVLDYALAPEVRLSEIARQARAGLAFLRAGGVPGLDARRIVVAGHSAGAHLAAMSQLGEAVPLDGLVLVSGVFELEPVRLSYVNDKVGMDAAEAAAMSPARQRPGALPPAVVAVGEREPVGFHEQSRHLAWAWREAGLDVRPMLLPGQDHFSMLDELGEPASALGAATARLLEGE